ncbi:MAG: hypothetical protein AAB632_01810, partial [Patescibacteria group bacterium]
LEIPKDSKLRDFAFPCFALAKTFKRNPVEIAKEIANNLKNGSGQTPVSGSSNPNPQPTPKSSSSEPYIKAAEKVIQDDKGNPYKEEEDHEAVQVQYLKDRFGKIIERE